MLILKIDNTNILRLLNPENPVSRRDIAKNLKMLEAGSIIPSDNELDGFVTGLMVDMIGEHLGHKKANIRLKQDEINKYVNTVYSEVSKINHKIENGSKAKSTIKRTVFDVDGNAHDMNVRIFWIEALNNDY